MGEKIFWNRLLLCIFALTQPHPTSAHGPPGRPWSRPDPDDDDNDSYPFPFFGPGFAAYTSTRHKMLIAHGVLASLAFVIFFPTGAILIRLGSFRGVWLVHGILQVFAYIVYAAAFGLGVWMVNSVPVDLLDAYHPIIGIVVFALLFFQPVLGLLHHFRFRKVGRRTVWSYAHLWLGRVAVTLGMINGGLGLFLASEAPAITRFAPQRGHMIAYGVVAGLVWVAWVVAAVVGERRRSRGRQNVVKEVDDEGRHELNSKEVPPGYTKENYGGQVYK